MTMCATVVDRLSNALLVSDHANAQQVLVKTNYPCRYNQRDQIRICYNGIMTRSIPPQITADCITILSRGCRC